MASFSISSAQLDILRPPTYDNAVIKKELHTHLPYATSKYGNSDEIRIPFQQTDANVLLSESLICIEGKMTASQHYTLACNAGAHAFSEIRLELNGVELDSVKSPGIATTMKGYASNLVGEVAALQSGAWTTPTSPKNQVVNASGDFNICLPLKSVLGFAEDYDRILINSRLDLVLIRANRDENMIVPIDPANAPDGDIDIVITKIEWKIPYVTVADPEKLFLMQVMNNDTEIQLAFRTWSLHTYPTLPPAQNHMWAIKTSVQLERPRFVIFGLQTARGNDRKKNASEFDSCQLKNVRLYIGSLSYPYDNMNLDFSKKKVAWLYDRYVNFQQSYYGVKKSQPMLTYDEFINRAPLIVIDCKHQTETVTASPVDIKLEFETATNIPPDTTAYCLIIHEQRVSYKALSSLVSRG